MPSPSPFAEIPQAPPDPILGLTEAFQADTNPRKVNLGVGVYQDSAGRVPVLATVRQAEARWLEEEATKSYLPIDGAPAYNAAVQRLVLGELSPAIAEGRAVTVQSLGGTGALKIGADFLKRFLPKATVYLSSPSWENHRALFEGAGFQVEQYPYYDPETHALNFHGFMDALAAMPEGSIVVLHACCHNPTGVDPSLAEWEQVVNLLSKRALVPFLDFAYQGFGEGLEEDARPVRLFAEAGIPCLVANSFSKNFSLYRERVGALTLLARDRDEARRALSQLKRVIRTNYSNPSSHGAQVVAIALTDPTLRSAWEQEVEEMRSRIHRMRRLFAERLNGHGTGRDFGFIVDQRGMFSYSGLSAEEARRLRSDFGVYVVESGRICVAALNDANMDYVCEAIARVLLR